MLLGLTINRTGQHRTIGLTEVTTDTTDTTDRN